MDMPGHEWTVSRLVIGFAHCISIDLVVAGFGKPSASQMSYIQSTAKGPENALTDTGPSLLASPDPALAWLHDYGCPHACTRRGCEYSDLLAAGSGAAPLSACT